MLSTIVLLSVAIILVILLTPIVRIPNESFMNEIDVPSCGLVLGGQGEEAEVHATDIHSRISRVRLTDPTSR